MMSQKKILVVDDEAAIRKLFEEAFSRDGYKIWTAESAEEALEILSKENIQVMFLDLNLPGMNGIELCKQIRKDKSKAIIHAVTGYASLFEVSACREASFDDYFTKPVNLGLLLKAAKNAFEKIERWESM
jgi:DNA-binding response OmpR family regulator